MSSKRSDEQTQDPNKHTTLKVIITVLVLIACWTVWYLIERSWVAILVLSIVGCVAAEYLGFKLIHKNKWFEQLSVEQAGFSIKRIVLGVLVVLMGVGVLIVGRMIYLQLFR